MNEKVLTHPYSGMGKNLEWIERAICLYIKCLPQLPIFGISLFIALIESLEFFI